MKRSQGSGEGGLTHVDSAGRARMVDVGPKGVTAREAVARAELEMAPATLAAILEGRVPKGDVLAVARLAGIMAGKRTAELIPLCHVLPLDVVEVRFAATGPGKLGIEAVARATARTGVEMEALAAASVAGLAVYDMCKALDRGMVLGRVRLVEKSGGRSGDYRREGEPRWLDLI